MINKISFIFNKDIKGKEKTKKIIVLIRDVKNLKFRFQVLFKNYTMRSYYLIKIKTIFYNFYYLFK